MVLVPWWQANAEYATINRILAEARTEAEALGDQWTPAADHDLRGARPGSGRACSRDGLTQMRESLRGRAASRSSASLRRSAAHAVGGAHGVWPRLGSRRALACWLCGHAAGGLADRGRRAALHDRAAGPAGPGGRRGDVGHHGAARRRAGGRGQVGRRGAPRRRRGQHDGSGGSGPGRSSGGPARGSRSPSCRARCCARISRCCWPTTQHGQRRARRPLLNDALETARATGERFCEAEILRVRAGLLRRARAAPESAAGDYDGRRRWRRRAGRVHARAARADGLGAPAPVRPRTCATPNSQACVAAAGRRRTEPESRRGSAERWRRR